MHLFSLLYKRRRLVLSKTLGLKRMRKFCQNKKLTINFWDDLKNGWKKVVTLILHLKYDFVDQNGWSVGLKLLL